MLLIPCPWCGPRDETEFRYGGQAHVPYPEDPAALTDEEWARYLFFRANPKGPSEERWSHTAGCRRWFPLLRDTTTHQILTPHPTPLGRRGRPPGAERAGKGAAPGGAEPPTPAQPHTSRTPLHFHFNGTPFTGHQGDTLAAALLANGLIHTSTSIELHRPRGIFSAGPEEPNALVQIEAPFPEPMLPATTVELYDGLVATGLPGRGRLATVPDPARYDAIHTHCDLLVVGAGPAGLAAATAAAHSGARVVLADDGPAPGGSLTGTGRLPGWAEETTARLEAAPEVRVLRRTTVFGHYDDNHLLAVERRTPHLGAAAPAALSRERVWRIRARRVVLATGAHERSLAFPDNDRPGVMLAASARTYVNRFGVLPGRRAVVLTTNDSAYAAALDLAGAGARVAAIVDTRPDAGEWARRARRAGIEVLTAHAVIGTAADAPDTPDGDRQDLSGHTPTGRTPSGPAPALGTRLTSVTVAPFGRSSPTREFPADLLLVSGGWNPVTHLYSQAGGRLRYDEVLGCFVPDGCRQAVEAVGGADGVFDLAEVLAQGAAAGARAVEAEGHPAAAPVLPRVATEPYTPPMHVFRVPGTAGGDSAPEFVDLQRDVTVADLARATAAGLRSLEHTKRYTTAGTANDQGKTSGVLAGGVVAELLGVEVSALGTTTFRPPFTPVAFAALAGRNRGALLDPVRVTALHERHVEHGAVFEDVGPWKRPRHYPRDGEDMAAAVLRECTAARGAVALLDASTLGKIDVQGPDAALLLDRLSTRTLSTLRTGAIRYHVMCRADGMVLDDGTAARLAPDRFLLTTTTGNAAAVLDWIEEWLQTEWTELRVHCTSVTEQWATLVLTGPRSRSVLASLAPELACDNESFPFMTLRETSVAGIAARVCFSGELAYELNVSPWHAVALWDALREAGAPYGITPYGTETMHVLRAEKGYPVIGQDTDGTVTPYDLGLGWAVSAKKRDFLGKRSFTRPDTARPDRRQLVGLLPEDPATLLPEGTQLVARSPLPAPPVPMLGHVTSSYRSAALGRTFALGLVEGGRGRVGDRLYAPVADRLVPVTVVDPVQYDPEGAHRDG
ncbi:sarcosine oxidase subunit delta [Streptomyces sp. NPDC004111]|uniref:sarcosine oxidase subunit delta n=1 Tax=Streptomyces sp. NPDC004111 TaxID=3364690 RepID=UPI0036C65C26